MSETITMRAFILTTCPPCGMGGDVKLLGIKSRMVSIEDIFVGLKDGKNIHDILIIFCPGNCFLHREDVKE